MFEMMSDVARDNIYRFMKSGNIQSVLKLLYAVPFSRKLNHNRNIKKLKKNPMELLNRVET
jgi:hypothetical protein